MAMMDTSKISEMSTRWFKEVGKHITEEPTDIRFVTGDYKTDMYIHYLEKESGLELYASTNKVVKSYKIVDEKKFAWFLLKYK